jgi:acyl dehydratase
MNEYRFDQLSVGMGAAFDALISAEMLDRFADLCGDRNPLHMDRDFAASAGHPDRVAHGMLSASLFSTLVGMHLPGKNALLHETKASFRSPIYPGDRVQVSGEIVSLNETCKQAEIKAQIRGPKGQKCVSATLKVGLAA